MTTKIMLLCVVVMMFLFGVAVIKVGLPRHEKAECLKWQQYKEDYPMFEATEWQKAQCLEYGIEL